MEYEKNKNEMKKKNRIEKNRKENKLLYSLSHDLCDLSKEKETN